MTSRRLQGLLTRHFSATEELVLSLCPNSIAVCPPCQFHDAVLPTTGASLAMTNRMPLPADTAPTEGAGCLQNPPKL